MSVKPDNKFWLGSYCRLGSEYPGDVTAISDVIRIVNDTGNQAPDDSWMLCLLEFYIDKLKQVPVELAFKDNGEFTAIYGGQDQHTFKQRVSNMGGSYRREIRIDPNKRIVNYNLTDLQTGQPEGFQLEEANIKNHENILKIKNISDLNEIEFGGADHFTGLEWHNRSFNGPYPIKYKIEISSLQYGKSESSDPASVSYHPYNALKANKDVWGINYPVAFQEIKLMNNCICYTMDSGNSQNGITCNF
jgi:hypothetical protein